MARRRRLEEVWLYFGWADSVVWFSAAHVPYAESGLSAALVADLERWRGDLSRLTSNGSAATAHEELTDVRGRAGDLASRLAAEIGPEFTVVVQQGRRSRRVRAAAPATNPAAAAAFAKLREHDRNWRAAVRGALAEGSPLHWDSSPES